MKLYEINRELRNIVEYGDVFVNADTGEVFQPKEIEQLYLNRNEKIEGCLIIYKEQLAEAEALRNEAKKLTERAKALENRAEWLKEYVRTNLNGENFKTERTAVSYRTSKAVELADGLILPDEYCRLKKEPNKELLTDLLKHGKKIAGVALVERRNMVVK